MLDVAIIFLITNQMYIMISVYICELWGYRSYWTILNSTQQQNLSGELLTYFHLLLLILYINEQKKVLIRYQHV